MKAIIRILTATSFAGSLIKMESDTTMASILLAAGVTGFMIYLEELK